MNLKIEFVINQIFASLFAGIAKINTEQKIKISKNFDLSNKQEIKEKITEKLDAFEKEFREYMEVNRTEFLSAIKKFAEENNTDNIGKLSEFAQNIINAYSDKILEEIRKRELIEKPITQEVP